MPYLNSVAGILIPKKKKKNSMEDIIKCIQASTNMEKEIKSFGACIIQDSEKLTKFIEVV